MVWQGFCSACRVTHQACLQHMECDGLSLLIWPQAINAGLAVPGFSTSLAYYDTYRRESVPANLVQVGCFSFLEYGLPLCQRLYDVCIHWSVQRGYHHWQCP